MMFVQGVVKFFMLAHLVASPAIDPRSFDYTPCAKINIR